MKFFLPLLSKLAALGAAGLFLVGVLDSSFLFLPFGNDLLIIALSARHPAKLPWYAACAAAGSVTGAMLVDALARKGGEQGLSRFLPEKRIEYIKSKVQKKAGWALALAALLPPPFPFTPFVAAAAALQYPRKNMVMVLLASRMARFIILGLLAIQFGRRILLLAQEPAVQLTLMGLLAVCIVGSAWSIYDWVRRSRHSISTKTGSQFTVKV